MPTFYQYHDVIAGSTYAPYTLELRDARNGQAPDMTGASVAVKITDETTGEIVVAAGVATPHATNPYWMEYFLTDQVAAKIVRPTTWLVEWTVVAGNGRTYHADKIGRSRVRPRGQ